MGYSRFPLELYNSCYWQVLLFPVLGAILDSRMPVHDNISVYTRATDKQNKYMIHLKVLDGCRTFVCHIFRPYSVHFRYLFFSHNMDKQTNQRHQNITFLAKELHRNE